MAAERLVFSVGNQNRGQNRPYLTCENRIQNIRTEIDKSTDQARTDARTQEQPLLTTENRTAGGSIDPLPVLGVKPDLSRHDLGTIGGSFHRARQAIHKAIDDGTVSVNQGANKSQLHVLAGDQ
jgi:hypothetical protein